MSELAIALIITQVVCLIGVVLFIWTDYKKKHPPLCDGCKNLNIKKRCLGICEKRYHCVRRYHEFNIPPKICREYRPKKEDTDG